MKLYELKCKNCGATLKVKENVESIKCEFCGSEFHVDEKDLIARDVAKTGLGIVKLTGVYMFIVPIISIIVFIGIALLIFFGVRNVGKSDFNFKFEYKEGTQNGIFVHDVIEDVVKSNKDNKNHQITVCLDNNCTSDKDELKEMKNNLDKWKDYEIEIYKDKKGYINKITIES